jgi:hypothetical protein
MNDIMHCYTTINIILEILGRPSLNPFQSEEELLSLIAGSREEPRNENSYKN